MGQTITSVADMVSYADKLRRAAKIAPNLEAGSKTQQSASRLEQKALNQVGQATTGIGALLDTFV
jgi:hypothetical protein